MSSAHCFYVVSKRCTTCFVVPSRSELKLGLGRSSGTSRSLFFTYEFHFRHHIERNPLSSCPPYSIHMQELFLLSQRPRCVCRISRASRHLCSAARRLQTVSYYITSLGRTHQSPDCPMSFYPFGEGPPRAADKGEFTPARATT